MSRKHMVPWRVYIAWVGTVDRCGYIGQQKGTICDTCSLCPPIWSILKPLFHCAYVSLSDHDDNYNDDDSTTNYMYMYFTPLHGNPHSTCTATIQCKQAPLDVYFEQIKWRSSCLCARVAPPITWLHSTYIVWTTESTYHIPVNFFRQMHGFLYKLQRLNHNFS